ncbi:hypothetical protein K2X89_03110, partial [Myxococcota bacterium]|nr:hypothetical protein [Myxococcota bacterium]
DERIRAAIRERLARELSARRIGLPKAVNTALEAPIDERVIVGGVQAVTDRLIRDRARLGLDLLIVRPQLEGIERSVLEGSLEALSRTVWPAVLSAGTESGTEAAPVVQSGARAGG